MHSNLGLCEISLLFFCKNELRCLVFWNTLQYYFLVSGVSNITTVENNAMKEKNFLEYKSTVFCSHCQTNVTVNSEVFLSDFPINDLFVFCNSPSEIGSNAILSNNCPNIM